jgi:hypothetical protein
MKAMPSFPGMTRQAAGFGLRITLPNENTIELDPD